MALERIRDALSPKQVIDPRLPAAAKPARDFEAQMKRIEARALKVETLANGAKLYHLPGGREIEQVPGKSPYVTKRGEWPAPQPKPADPALPAPPASLPTAPAPAATTPTRPATTPPAGSK